jgi:hypothetical protein
MYHPKVGLFVAALAALAPALSMASPERDALNACARAFASSLASPGSTAPSFKVAYRANLYTGSMLEFYSREFTFDLNAKDPKTGLAIARASCSTDSSGAVIALSSLPVASRTLTAQD